MIRARLQICTSSPLFNKDACGPPSALFCIVYPFREGRSAPSLTTELPDQPGGGSLLAGRATPTRPGFFSSPGLVAAAAFKACTRQPYLHGTSVKSRREDRATQPNERPSPRYPCYLGPKPAYQDHGRKSETRMCWGVLWFVKSPLCPFLRVETRAKGEQRAGSS